MISASRAGGKFGPTNCFLISCFQSGILHPRDSADSATLTLERESFLTLGCETVVTPPSLIGFFNPASLDQASMFETVEQRIQRGNMESGVGFVWSNRTSVPNRSDRRIRIRTAKPGHRRSRERDRWDREPSSWPDSMPPSCGKKKRTGLVRTLESENPSQMGLGRELREYLPPSRTAA